MRPGWQKTVVVFGVFDLMVLTERELPLELFSDGTVEVNGNIRVNRSQEALLRGSSRSKIFNMKPSP